MGPDWQHTKGEPLDPTLTLHTPLHFPYLTLLPFLPLNCTAYVFLTVTAHYSAKFKPIL